MREIEEIKGINKYKELNDKIEIKPNYYLEYKGSIVRSADRRKTIKKIPIGYEIIERRLKNEENKEEKIRRAGIEEILKPDEPIEISDMIVPLGNPSSCSRNYVIESLDKIVDIKKEKLKEMMDGHTELLRRLYGLLYGKILKKKDIIPSRWKVGNVGDWIESRGDIVKEYYKMVELWYQNQRNLINTLDSSHYKNAIIRQIKKKNGRIFKEISIRDELGFNLSQHTQKGKAEEMIEVRKVNYEKLKNKKEKVVKTLRTTERIYYLRKNRKMKRIIEKIMYKKYILELKREMKEKSTENINTIKLRLKHINTLGKELYLKYVRLNSRAMLNYRNTSIKRIMNNKPRIDLLNRLILNLKLKKKEGLNLYISRERLKKRYKRRGKELMKKEIIRKRLQKTKWSMTRELKEIDKGIEKKPISYDHLWENIRFFEINGETSDVYPMNTYDLTDPKYYY